MISSTVTIILMRFSFSSFVPMVVSLTSGVNTSQTIWRNRGSFQQTHLSIPENRPSRSSRMLVHLNINANLPKKMNSALNNFWRELRNSRSWTCSAELICRLRWMNWSVVVSPLVGRLESHIADYGRELTVLETETKETVWSVGMIEFLLFRDLGMTGVWDVWSFIGATFVLE